MRRTMRAAASAGVALLLTAGCAGGSEGGTDARIRVDKPVALADEPVRIRVTGLRADAEATVTAQATDREGERWEGRAVFTADGTGTVDLTRDRPRSGTYDQADGMGLFWSMRPETAPTDASRFETRWPEQQRAYDVDITVESDGTPVARRTLTRTWMRDGVRHRPLTVGEDEVHGVLYQPPADLPARPPVLSFGGSAGGVGERYSAALLASRGHPVLVLCYFDCPGRPDTLQRIGLEYFATALRLLDREAGEGPQRVSVIGRSRGSEAAQLLGHHYPDLVENVVVYAPSRDTHRGFPEGDVAWTKDGRPVEHSPIPLDRVRGTVLAIAGGADGLSPSGPAAEEIGGQRGDSGQRHRALVYPDAGHALGTYPYTATATYLRHPVTDRYVDLGGSLAADARARADSWPRVRLLLGS
ncbi:acyl-CoA thioesterase/bile acid-CoA:amino acid N-acyltransferase family protein [Streptomyces sp. WMMC1477]|uniref:acyl-CoA thioesterase/bile acid-CoA:amino acid N-acyltransferase family protein n=1 Tax=Streptomyces sp. WMMC1477 TaxID=3015155 RepID=UPI0022B73909|nr:acyl-CoA thioesterase/bile acid-CoA:amino acid N-acyltransferase family protein [Streptomyces sp. WMMC1477]MCZ7430460.1 acyl-CoA thioesterase/bile acid-CoA:amino acid N-acyltransferase family protein [Streptomyces sp. WMMC1477]